MERASGRAPLAVPRAWASAAVVAGVLGACSTRAFSGESPSIPSLFADEPPHALIRRFEGDDPLTGTAIVVHREVLRDQDSPVVFIRTTVTNTGHGTEEIRSAPLLSGTFRTGPDLEAARYRPLTYRNDVWYGSTYWTGPDWTRVGKDWHHPGENTPSVRRLTAPRDGRVSIKGRVFKADTNQGGGDGVRVAVRHGTRTVWEATLDGGDDTGLESNVSLDVKKGDPIRFVVHKRGQIYFDTTRWDPVIVYDTGEYYRASEGFSTTLQGEWSYEMEVGQMTEAGLPRLHGYGHGLFLRQAVPAPGRTITWSRRDGPPLWVLADGLDRSGIVLATSGEIPCRLQVAPTDGRDLRVMLTAGDPATPLTLEPGRSVRLPCYAVAAYRGPWMKGSEFADRLVGDKALEGLREQIAAAFHPVAAGFDTSPGEPHGPPGSLPVEVGLWTMVQADWLAEDGLWDNRFRDRGLRRERPREAAEALMSATVRHAEKAYWLLADLGEDLPADMARKKAQELGRLALEARRPGLDLEERCLVYLRMRWWKRRLALSNPLLRFGKLLFTKRVPTSYSHLVMQYFGWRARPGGGMYVLERPGHSLTCRDILGGKLSEGNVLEPRLSYDARRIVFSFVDSAGRNYDPARLTNHDRDDEGFYHIYEVNVDGSGLRQLTRGPFDDVMPAYLPDGGIVFCSTRRRGHARCFGAQFSPRWHVYALHRMGADGEDLRPLSFHDTNEWFPSVGHDGRILYSRWDYIDRDAVTHQNLWITHPDGTGAAALWGNATASPHCTFQIQPIPNSSRIVFTAAAHHSIAAGSIAVLDPRTASDGHAGITRITPEVPLPEAEARDIREYYAAPWPLSETYFLVAYSARPLVWEPGGNDPSALGVYILDAFGNRELLYRDPEIGSTNPCPLSPRPSPPALPSQLPGKTRSALASQLPGRTPSVPASQLPGRAPPAGEVILLDVYRGLGEVPRGSVKELRIVQIFPKTTPVANAPPIGLAGEENARAILGTVPVEPDGSSRFLLPARKPVLFQALDEDGFALQVMRSVAYVQPGERVTCIGCHENRRTSPPPAVAMALRRPPSEINAGVLEGRPFSFMTTVQPILDRHCTGCHGGERTEEGIDLRGLPDRGFTKSYWSLCGGTNFSGAGTNPKNAREALVPRFGARNPVQVTPPGGMYGARGSRLLRMLRQGHHDVKLGPEDLRRMAAWIDANAIFYGAYDPEDQARQLRGEDLAMPAIQ